MLGKRYSHHGISAVVFIHEGYRPHVRQRYRRGDAEVRVWIEHDPPTRFPWVHIYPRRYRHRMEFGVMPPGHELNAPHRRLMMVSQTRVALRVLAATLAIQSIHGTERLWPRTQMTLHQLRVAVSIINR